jgi:hypothetical protein
LQLTKELVILFGLEQNLNWTLLLVFLAAWVATLLVTSATAAGFYAFTIYSPSYVPW